jgi:ribose 5-phosphate isomerase RpiB
MKSVNVEEYLKHEFTQEEHDERVADIRRIHAEIHQAALEDPRNREAEH